MGHLPSRFMLLIILLASGFQLFKCAKPRKVRLSIVVGSNVYRHLDIPTLKRSVLDNLNSSLLDRNYTLDINIRQYQNLTQISSSFPTDNSTKSNSSMACLGFLFLDRKFGNIQFSIDNNRGGLIYVLEPENCKMALVQQRKENLVCPIYKSMDMKLLKLSIKYFFFTKISVVYVDNPCERIFVHRMLKELPLVKFNQHAGTPRLIELKVHRLATNNPSATEILDALYSVKLHSPNLIIVLCELNVLDLVIRMAASFSLLSFGNAWLVFNVDHFEMLTRTPSQFLVIRPLHPREEHIWKPSVIRSVLTFYTREVIDTAKNSRLSIPRCHSKVMEPFKSLAIRAQPPNCTNTIDSPVALQHLTQAKTWQTVLLHSEKTGTTIQSTSSEYMRLYKAMLHGSHVKIVSILDPPFTMAAKHLLRNNKQQICEHGIICQVPVKSLSRNRTIWNRTCCIGFSVDLIEKLSADNNFYADVYIVEDGFYGAVSNGKWDGMVGDVYNGMADLAVAGLTINNERSTIIDFAEPFMRVDIGIVIPSNATPLRFVNFEFIKYLSRELLWLIFATFVIGTVLVYIFENEQFVLVRFFNPYSQPPVYPWREGFSYFSGLTFQRDLGGKNPHRGGARVTAIIFAFAMVIIMTTYTAVLTASKVKQEESNPFLGIKDPRMQNPTEDFKFATVAQTSIEAFFRRSPDPVLHNMYLFMRKYNTPNTNAAIERLLSGNLQAFINEYPFMLHYISKQTDCKLKIVGDPITQAGYGIALRKGSPWKHRLSQSILLYKEDGTLERLTRKWLKNFCKNSNQTMVQLASLPLEYFGGAYLILVASLAVSLMLLGAEHVYHRYHRRVVDPIHEVLANWKTTRAGRRNAVQIDSLEKWQQENLHRQDLGIAIDCSSAEDVEEYSDIKEPNSPINQTIKS